MPNATIPHKDNKTVNLFTLTLNGNSIGDVVLGNSNIEKEIHDINNALYNRAYERLEFNKEPIIEVTVTDVQYDNIGLILGTAAATISASTANWGVTTGFAIKDDTMVYINGDSSKITCASIVLNSAASGGGTTYTEDDDYVVDAARCMVQCIPTGTHTLIDDTTVYVESGTYATAASERVYISENRIDTEIASGVLLSHTYPDKKVLTIYLPKATITSPLNLSFVTEGLMELPMTIKGLLDTTQTSGRAFGYIDTTTA